MTQAGNPYSIGIYTFTCYPSKTVCSCPVEGHMHCSLKCLLHSFMYTELDYEIKCNIMILVQDIYDLYLKKRIRKYQKGQAEIVKSEDSQDRDQQKRNANRVRTKLK